MAYLEENDHIHCVLGARNCLVSGEDHNITVKVNNIGLRREESRRKQERLSITCVDGLLLRLV